MDKISNYMRVLQWDKKPIYTVVGLKIYVYTKINAFQIFNDGLIPESIRSLSNIFNSV